MACSYNNECLNLVHGQEIDSPFQSLQRNTLRSH